MLSEFLNEVNRRTELGRRLSEDAEMWVDRIARDVGLRPERVEETREMRLRMFRFFSESIAVPGLFDQGCWVVPAAELKTLLEAGATIPGIELGEKEFNVTYGRGMTTDGAGVSAARHQSGLFVFPAKANEDSAEVLRSGLEVFLKAGLLGAAFHELVELSILLGVQPAVPFMRWFSDGFANVMAEDYLRILQGDSAVDQFRDLFSTEPFQDLKSTLNLQYWIEFGYEIDVLLEALQRRQNARYAFETAEARRLTRQYGQDLVRRVMEGCRERRPGDQERMETADLFHVLQETTGEDGP